MLCFASDKNSLDAIPTTPAIPPPFNETRHILSIEVTAFTAPPLRDDSCDIRVPSSAGAKVFFIITGIFFCMTGCIASG